MTFFKSGSLLVGFLISFLFFLYLIIFPQKLEIHGQESPSIYLSNEESSFRSGSLVPLPQTAEPSVRLGTYSGSVQANVSVYPATEDLLFKFLIHDQEGKKIYKTDVSNVQPVASEQVTISNSSGGSKINLPDLPIGSWLLRVSYSNQTAEFIILRSDHGVVAAETGNEIIFWAQNFKSRRSVTSGTLTLYSLVNNQTQLASTAFDNQGIAKTPILPASNIAVARFGKDLVVIPINPNVVDSYYNNRFGKPIKTTKYFIFTDRPLYKKGDAVYFKAVIRDDDALYSVPKGRVTVKVSKDYNFDEPLLIKDFPISADGTVFGEYKISPDSPAGYYQIKFEVPSDDPTKQPSSDYANFEIQHYRKPEYSLDIKTEKTELIMNEKANMEISADYFFGQPVRNEKIKYSVASSNYYEYEYQQDQKYNLSDDVKPGYYWYGGYKVTDGELILNKKGKANISFNAKLPPDQKKEDRYAEPRLGRNQIFSIEATLDDGSGNPSLARKNILVYAGEFNIFRKESSRIGKVGEEIRLPLILVPHFSGSVSGINISAGVKRENWVPYQEPDKKYPSYKKEEEDLPQIWATTDQNGNANLSFVPQKPGSYKITAKALDKRGNPIEKIFYLYITSDKDYYSFEGADSVLNISAERDKYQPTETARLTIFSNVSDTDVFLAIERARVYRFQVLRIEGNTAYLDVPLGSLDIPNIFASASTFAGNKYSRDSVKLVVSSDSKKLIIDLKTEREKYGPAESVKVDIQTKDTNGNPVRSDIALWAVDKALFELSNLDYQTIFDTFWYERYNFTPYAHSLEGIGGEGGGAGGCFSADTLVYTEDGSLKRIDQVKVGDKVKTRISEGNSNQVSTTVKKVHQREVGGILIINDDLKITPNHKIWVNKAWKQAGSIQVGDVLTDNRNEEVVVSSIEWQKGKFTVYNLETENYHTFFANTFWVHNQKGGVDRTVFKDTAYWNPSVYTNSQGQASITFQLPDNLTTWVISAIGNTADTVVGQGRVEIIAQKDIFIRPVLPNILRVGDKAVFNAIIHNFTDKEQQLEAKLESNSLKIESDDTQNIKIAPAEVKEVSWRVTASKEADAEQLKYSVLFRKDKKLIDSATLTLPIRPFGFVEKEVTSGQGDVSFPINFLENTDKSKTKIVLDLSPTIIGPVISAMQYLIGYPYGCVEQITSRLAPALMAKQSPQIFSKVTGDKNIDKIIKDSINKLSSYQTGEGWGWWGNNQGSHFVTAYVLENLIMVRNLGFVTANDLIKQAQVFLEKEEVYDRESKNSIPLDNEKGVIRAYGLSLLPYDKRVLVASFDNLTPDILSLAVLANITNNNKDAQTNGLSKLLSLAKTQGDESYFDEGSKQNFGSKEASTALAVRAMVAGGVDVQTITPFIRFLIKSKNQGFFANTFATSQTVKAISEFAKAYKETTPNYSYTIRLDNKDIKAGKVSDPQGDIPQTSISIDDVKAGSVLGIEQTGQGQLYWNLTLEQFNIDRNAKEVDKGFNVRREYSNSKGGNKISVGDTVVVKITVWGLDTPDNYALIHDELPAGLVPININFKNEQYPLPEDTVQPTPSDFNVSGMEVTENGMDLSLYEIKNGTNTYTYKARAVSEGVFSAPPVLVELMYNPKVYGRSRVSTLTVEGVSKTEQIRFEVILIVAFILIGGGVGFLVFKRLRSSQE